ncbi:MAG: hypothetical protein HKL80_07195 [Acidimicrobiales bacterium]|nr:hypothetical protein [Acidimicrobiales bacterium]
MGVTTSSSGLIVRAEWDDSVYPTGTKITDKQLAELKLQPHQWHGEWNYSTGSKRHRPTSK